ncbi:TPA: hypothetical protein HA372_04205 [Candidatus Woesearchaeota archaeon]|nr:MAG: hypothetical protein QT04_C0058G0015 [archaeon GW2011_AR11]HII64496.1 hypothetical protein [Candidatus Woesearchaeota archaeon]HIJ18860.1 hypothetical protein [Candidatus Woesearchaeota archaeon]
MRLETTVRNLALAGTAALGIGLGSANAAEYNPHGYPVPSVGSLRPYQTVMYDVNKIIPGKETKIQRYHLPSGGKVAVLSVDDKIFAYSIKEPNQNRWYAIRDRDGSGNFTEKFSHGEPFDVPSWLVNRKLSRK